MLESAGQDSTEAFEDIGHSTDAREVLEKYLIGKLPDDVREIKNAPHLGLHYYMLSTLHTGTYRNPGTRWA